MFSFSSKSYYSELAELMQTEKFQFNTSHKINHLSFGDPKHFYFIHKWFEDETLSPLEGWESTDKAFRAFSYYLNVVPSTYKIKNEELHVYQYVKTTAAKDITMIYQEMPSVEFNYTVSGATLYYEVYRERLVHFLIQVFAIVGGMFTVAGIVDLMVYKGVTKLLEKAEMNKLG